MQVIRSSHMGFCMGVKRAMQIVRDVIDSHPVSPVYTFGPLIHNRLVLEDLESKGVGVIEDLQEACGIVIIRAHGVHPGIMRTLDEKSTVSLIDATCPRVLYSQKKISDASKQGRPVVIVGDSSHGEVIGMAGYASSVDIIQSIEEAEAITVPPDSLIISQTTFSEDKYNDICKVLLSRSSGILISKSICPATEKRQNALIKLIDDVDAVIVIGGKNSANTVGLYNTSLRYNSNSWHIESADEIPDKIFLFRKVGITAGASTPEWIIKEVEDKLKSY